MAYFIVACAKYKIFTKARNIVKCKSSLERFQRELFR